MRKGFQITFSTPFARQKGPFKEVFAMYRRGEFGQVARALRVLDALRGFKLGRWVNEIAEEMGVNKRTVRRDIAELQDAGFDIEITEDDRRAIARLIDERNYSHVPITKRERLTLLAVRSVFDVLRGTPFLEDVESVMTKLKQRMSDKDRSELAAFGERFFYMPDHGTKSYEGKEDIIDAIQTGLLAHKVVEFSYRDGRGKARSGYLAPYGMILYRHGLYVVGDYLKAPNAPTSSGTRVVFAIERFIEAEHLREHEFAVARDFNMREMLDLAGAFGPYLPGPNGPHLIVVEFSAARAELATSRTWNVTQTVEKLADGRARISFPAPNIAPIASWILEWGGHARAINPPELVKMATEESRTMAELFAHLSKEATP
ncbi:MAG TPA: WYL domain-containing protein [Kofleriaceae bacterium]|nr:WYL domain-containing protein [Kofleriaceae bacterium]